MKALFGRRFTSSIRATSPRQNIRRRRFRFEQLEGRAMLAVTSGDFNGDGRDDLVVGVSLEDLSVGLDPDAIANAGAVNVIYGGKNGLRSTGNQFWYQDSPGINGNANTNDQFGMALAVGDFDGDSFDDLAIGVPEDEVDGVVNAGSVNIIYGSSDGLKAAGDQLWSQNSPGINDTAESNNRFGGQLTTGDFDGDGFSDLAIGLFESVSGAIAAGAVSVIYGSSSGLQGSGDQFWHQDVSGINGVAQVGEGFGYSLSAADFNDDGRDDLAIGVFLDTVAGISTAGAVNVIYGSSSGLTASGDQLFSQETSGVFGVAENADRFGEALAAGDFDRDGVADLAIAAPGEDGSTGGQDFEGIVLILFGSNAKLTGTGSQSFTRVDFSELTSTVGAFGATLAAGDFDDDGFDDLTIGAPGAQVNGTNAGLVLAVYGSADGLDYSSAQVWNQNSGSIKDVAQNLDGFGSALGTGDFDGNGRADLIVAVPGESLTASNTGLVHVIYGFLGGLTDGANQTWAQGVNGILGNQEDNDLFGR